MAYSPTHGNVIQVGGAMSFGVWRNNGREPNGNSLVPQIQETDTGPHQPNVEVDVPTSTEEQMVTTTIQSVTLTEEPNIGEEGLTEAEPPQITTAPPPPECDGFTPIVGSNFFPSPSDVISETTSTFDECCSQVTFGVSKWLEAPPTEVFFSGSFV